MRGYVSFFSSPYQFAKHMVLAAFSIGLYQIGVFTRFLRSDMLDVLNQDYITVAKSKGLPRKTIIAKHVLKNSLISFVTVFGMSLGALIGNTVIVEQIFGIPGIGWLLFNSILNRDYAMVQGIIVVIAFSFAFINLLVDLIYAWLNPKIQYEKER